MIAEKVETILSRSVANTRPRDYYDIHILYTLRGEQCDRHILREALERTAKKRDSTHILADFPNILSGIRNSQELRTFWEKYQKNYDYAKDITFDDTCQTVENILKWIL